MTYFLNCWLGETSIVNAQCADIDKRLHNSTKKQVDVPNYILLRPSDVFLDFNQLQYCGRQWLNWWEYNICHLFSNLESTNDSPQLATK